MHEKKREKRMKKGILLLIVCSLVFGKLNAQNWDINTVKKVNGWEMHNLSKAFSHSGPILSVGIPTVMGVYALIQKDEPLLKDAIYIGTSVIEAVGLTYGLKYTFDRQRPY